MKFTRSLGLCASALLLGVTDASAAVTLNNAQLSYNGAEILNTGTLIFAWDTNGNGVTDPIVNGITFNKVQPGSVSFSGNFSTNIVDHVATSGLYGSNAAMAELMDSFTANNGDGQGTVMTISGLSIGQQYRIQMLHHQVATAGTRDMEVHFGTLGTDPGSGAFSAAGNNGRIVTITFDATATSQSFFIRAGGNDRTVLNGAVLFAVPEPSAALLGGLGVLAMLRRRRD